MDNPYTAGHADPSASPESGSLVTQRVYDALGGTKPWVRFLAILGFIGSGLMLLGGVFMLLGGGLMAFAGASSGKSPAGALPFAGFQVAIAIAYIVMGVLYLFPSLKLWGYGNQISRMLLSRSVDDLEGALEQQRSFWKFVGIMMIALMILYALIIVGAIIAAVVGVLNGTGFAP